MEKHAMKRSAEVLREYATLIEESEIHRSGPLKGKCEPKIESEVTEYRELAAKLEADAWVSVDERLPDDDITVVIACEDADEPVWLGYHDDAGWSNVDGMPLPRVTHWKPMPEAPHG